MKTYKAFGNDKNEEKLIFTGYLGTSFPPLDLRTEYFTANGMKRLTRKPR